MRLVELLFVVAEEAGPWVPGWLLWHAVPVAVMRAGGSDAPAWKLFAYSAGVFWFINVFAAFALAYRVVVRMEGEA